MQLHTLTPQQMVDTFNFDSLKKSNYIGPLDLPGDIKSPYRYKQIRLPMNPRSFVPGVTQRSPTNFEAAIYVNNKRLVIGSFETRELASAAVQCAMRSLKSGVTR